MEITLFPVSLHALLPSILSFSKYIEVLQKKREQTAVHSPEWKQQLY